MPRDGGGGISLPRSVSLDVGGGGEGALNSRSILQEGGGSLNLGRECGALSVRHPVGVGMQVVAVWVGAVLSAGGVVGEAAGGG